MPAFTQSPTEKTLLKETLNKAGSKNRIELVKLKESLVVEQFGPEYTKDKVKVSESVTLTPRHQYFFIVPSLEFYSWKVSEANPSGTRHIPSGHFAFESNVTDKGYLDFGKVTKIGGSGLSETKCVTFKIKRFTEKFGATNFRLWMAGDSGLGSYGSAYSVNIETSQIWQKNKTLGSGQLSILPNSLPAHQNILRNDGFAFMDSGEDNQNVTPDSDIHTSQYIYLSLNTGNAFATGSYGVGGIGSMKLRCSFDYFLGGYG